MIWRRGQGRTRGWSLCRVDRAVYAVDCFSLLSMAVAVSGYRGSFRSATQIYRDAASSNRQLATRIVYNCIWRWRRRRSKRKQIPRTSHIRTNRIRSNSVSRALRKPSTSHVYNKSRVLLSSQYMTRIFFDETTNRRRRRRRRFTLPCVFRGRVIVMWGIHVSDLIM